MEVSPTLTIDNIASMVTPQLSNAGSFFNIVPVPEGPFSASSSPRNTSISSAAAQIRALAESRNEANTDSSRNVPRTTSSTAGTSSNGQAPPLNIPFRSLIPVPLTSMGSLHTFDSGLPCHSVWALEPSRRRHNAGGSRTPSAHQQPALTPNFPGRQEDQLQQVISNIVMSLLNHSHNQAPGNAAAGVTVLTSRSGDTPRESSIFTTASSQANRGRASPPDVPSSTQVPPSQGNLPPRPGFATGNSSMRFMLSNIGLANKTIAEVFTGIRDCDLDLLGSFFCFLASKLTFQDVVDIGSGDFESITRIRIPLQNYLRENVFKTENPQPSDYDAVVQAILANEELKMLNFLLQAEVAENECASYVTAFKALIRENIHKVFDALLGRSDIPSGTTYGQHVARTCRELFEKFLQLNSRYSNLDVIALERVLRRQLEPLSQLVDPAYQSVVRVLIFSSLYRLTSGSRNAMSTSSDSSEPAPSSSTDANKKKDEKKAESSERPPQREFTFGNHVNVESSGDIFSNRNLPRGAFTEGSEDGAAPALAAFARIAEQTTALLRGNNRNNDSRPTGVNLVSIRPDSWASSIPQDWVPIIARDVQRQRRQAPQAPFSNAYLSGMPSKRRKIMSNDTPALLEHSQSALSDMLLQAISSADVKPRTSMEEVKADVSKDPSLQSSFNEHMKHAIQERLQRDLDYCSDKFPNSEKYYNI
uniref:Large proline-rich protein BAG6 n=1 Tax=Parasteatoda tepidariorum TaxID=114398 RepID=A0A2L2Y658_PARTP